MTPSPNQASLDADSLLHQFVTVADPEDAELCMGKLLSNHARPLIRDVLKGKLSSGRSSCKEEEFKDGEDICQEVLIQLLRRLRALRETRDVSGLTNFRGYVAVSTQNAFYQYIRVKHPVRCKLKNRIRYLLNHRPELATWETRSGLFLCGFRTWRHLQPTLEIDHQEFERFKLTQSSEIYQARDSTEKTIALVLKWLGKPTTVDEIVNVVGDLVGEVDVQGHNSCDEDDVAICDLLPDPSPSIEIQLEQKRYMTQLWEEIRLLPKNQRTAFLLNLRDRSNSDALILFTMLGIANMRQIAAALEIEPDRFAELWNRLPLDDNSIAAQIAVTRQQVINLRKSAKERLARRMVRI